MKRPRNALQEIHVTILGMNGCGKSGMQILELFLTRIQNAQNKLIRFSALTVKYLTKRFITEYDPNIEDTYCKHELLRGQENMIWIMDTVEGVSPRTLTSQRTRSLDSFEKPPPPSSLLPLLLPPPLPPPPLSPPSSSPRSPPSSSPRSPPSSPPLPLPPPL